MTDRKPRKGDRVSVTTVWRAWGTDADRVAWRASESSKGMTCAGETRLPPRATYLRAEEGERLTGLTVLKMRATSCPTSWGHYSTPKGCALLVDDEGVEWYATASALRVEG